jgi:hypothetical protein
MAFTETLAGSLGGLGRGRLEGADILELLGDSEEERVETVAGMLRQSSGQEINEFMRIGQMAFMRVSQERAGQPVDVIPEAENDDDRPSRRRRPRRRSSSWLL